MPWNLERIELFFYNAGENRWEMFVEPNGKENYAVSTHPDCFYRRQLQRLLQTVRRAFQTRVRESSFPNITVPPSPLYPLTDVLLDFDDVKLKDPAIRPDFAKYCWEALRREG